MEAPAGHEGRHPRFHRGAPGRILDQVTVRKTSALSAPNSPAIPSALRGAFARSANERISNGGKKRVGLYLERVSIVWRQSRVQRPVRFSVRSRDFANAV